MPRQLNPHLRRDLLRAAVTLLDQRDDASFSMRELAAQVEYSVTAVYRCFEHKSHLLQALQLHLFQQLPEQLMPALLESGRPDQIRALGAAFIRWGLAHPARYRFMFHTTEADALLDEADQEVARAGLRLLEQLIAEGVEAGEFAEQDAAASATLLFASLHGLISLYTAQRLDPAHISDLQVFYEDHATLWMSRLLTPQG